MLLKAVSVLAAFGLFAFLAQGVFGRVSVEVDGKRDLVGVGDTVAEIVAEHPHSARPGDLLSAADRHVVVLGGGGAVRVRLNGEAASPEVRVKPGDRLETLSGADSVEPTVEETRSIPAPTRYEGRGSIVAVAATGSAGVERLVVGAVSGDVVASETVLPAKPKVVRRALGKKIVALTFDDGPWPTQTAQVLDILKAEDVHATFFTVGFRVGKAQALAKRIVAEGSAIGNHTYNHVDLSGASPEIVRREIRSENELVQRVTGVKPKWFRPPMGRIDGPAYNEIKAAGLRPVLWTVDPQDWRKGATAEQIKRAVTSAVKPGSVILLHDGGGNRSETIKALPGIIHELRASGYSFVLLDDLPGAPKWRW